MKRFSGTEICIVIAILAVSTAIAISGFWPGRKKPDDAAIRRAMDDQPTLPNLTAKTPAWTYLGTASDGFASASVLRTTDPDTGATIYVMIGVARGGIFVLPKEQAK